MKAASARPWTGTCAAAAPGYAAGASGWDLIGAARCGNPRLPGSSPAGVRGLTSELLDELGGAAHTVPGADPRAGRGEFGAKRGLVEQAVDGPGELGRGHPVGVEADAEAEFIYALRVVV